MICSGDTASLQRWHNDDINACHYAIEVSTANPGTF